MASDVPSTMAYDEACKEVVDIRTAKPKILLKKESMGSEKQISVDPISLRESSNHQQMPPTTCSPIHVMIPMASWGRSRLVAQSVANSVPSTPGAVPKVPKKRSKKHFDSVSSAIHRQDSIAVANLDRLRQIHLQRSKSCGEGRSSVPAEDIDLFVTNKPADVQNKRNDEHSNHYFSNHRNVDDNVGGGTDTLEKKFKCKALCLHLPAFGKVKSVRARRQWSDVSQAKELETGHVVSKRASLEMFECASLDSSSLINDDDEDTSNLFFDLPLELIKCSINDTDSPVTTGFVFEEDHKGVLKNSASTCNTKDDFTAFIEAQSA